MTKTVYIITKYHFYYGIEDIVYISKDYKKAIEFLKEYTNNLDNNMGLRLREYQYDTVYDIDESKTTIKHIQKEDGCLKQWINGKWRKIN